MHSVLALQETIGIFSALNLHGYALYSGLVAFLQVAYRHLVTMSLGPAHIHSHEHLRPILALGSTGTTVYLHHAVHRVFLLAQHVHQLQLLNCAYRLVVVFVDLFLGKHVVLVEVERQFQFIGTGSHLLIPVDPLLKALHLLHLFLRTLRIVPEIRSLRTQLFFFVLYFLRVYVEIVMQCFGTFHHVFQLI